MLLSFPLRLLETAGVLSALKNALDEPLILSDPNLAQVLLLAAYRGEHFMKNSSHMSGAFSEFRQNQTRKDEIMAIFLAQIMHLKAKELKFQSWPERN